MKHTPATSYFIFDLHEVLCHPNYLQIVKLYLHSDKKWVLFKYCFHLGLLYKIFRLWRQGATAATYFAYIRHHYPELAPCIPLIIEMANAQVPNEKTLHIVANLKQQGYRLDILSNIDVEILDDLRSKCPHVFDYFTCIQGTSAKIPYGKPHAQIYQDYLHHHRDDHKQMFFIDNKKENINAAQKFGMIGIRYRSAEKLRKQLGEFGIVV